MDIIANVKAVLELKDYFFVVPDYQREYVWKADTHVSRFLQDINDEFAPSAKIQSNYFIGSTIIVKRNDNAFDVIDGQQRLTTIVISLCAIRDKLQTMEIQEQELCIPKEELLKIIKELLYTYDIPSRKHTPRLSLQYIESKGYLNKLIAEAKYTDIITPSVQRMIEAYNTVLDFLADLKESSEDTLVGFITFFLYNVKMVIIRPDDLGSALKIFETINERGVGLNAMDLLKNLLFSYASPDEFESIKKIWRDMLDNVDKSGDGDKPLRFLRYFLMAQYHDGIIREDDIYKWLISDAGKKAVRYISAPVDFAKELKGASIRYNKYIKATIADDIDDTYPSVTGIGYLSKKTSRQHLVLLMALKDNIGDAAINLLAANIESLAFYYSINRVQTKSYEEKFANWAAKLRLVKTTEDLIFFLNDDFAREVEEQRIKFNAQFASKSQFDLNPQYRVKYILGRIENFIRDKVKFPIAGHDFYQCQQLEHILPQTASNIPSDKFPQQYDYSNTVYRIGNLTLLEAPINQSLNYSNDISSNEWFDIKRTAYLNSAILLTRTIAGVKIGESTSFNGFVTEKLQAFEEWGMKDVAARQEMMRSLMLEIWKLEL